MTLKTLTPIEHKERHELLHRHLDELIADFIGITGGLPSKTTLTEFMKWSHDQTLEPTVERTHNTQGLKE